MPSSSTCRLFSDIGIGAAVFNITQFIFIQIQLKRNGGDRRDALPFFFPGKNEAPEVFLPFFSSEERKQKI